MVSLDLLPFVTDSDKENHQSEKTYSSLTVGSETNYENKRSLEL